VRSESLQNISKLNGMHAYEVSQVDKDLAAAGRAQQTTEAVPRTSSLSAHRLRTYMYALADGCDALRGRAAALVLHPAIQHAHHAVKFVAQL